MAEAPLWFTDDAVVITPELRVFTTDWEWGTVTPEQFTRGGLTDPGGEHFDGWFEVKLDSGRTKTYNGDRLSTVKPTPMR